VSIAKEYNNNHESIQLIIKSFKNTKEKKKRLKSSIVALQKKLDQRSLGVKIILAGEII
jgi:hypothetical protein